MSEKFSSGVTPQPSDTERQLLVKILNSLNSGSTGSGGTFSGSGAPTTQVPAGSAGTYWDYTNGILYMWNPVSKTWTQ